MTQYDAGPGDWSDREWEAPDHKHKPHARRRLTLPPWALAVGLAGAVILSCVGLVLLVRAMRQDRAKDTPTALPLETSQAPLATATYALEQPATSVVTPTETAELPISPTAQATVPTEIGPGAQVVVQGTGAAGLNLRAEPNGRVVTAVKERAVLLVLEGPRDAGGYTWWKVRAADGKEGWAASRYLVLKTEP